MVDSYTHHVRDIIKRIPFGKVTTYGTIAAYAGNPSGARQVARILHSSSKKHGLPWHRVVNRKGQISPRPTMSHILQKELLENEGVVFEKNGTIDFSLFYWQPDGFDDENI